MKIIAEHNMTEQTEQKITLYVISKNWHRRGDKVCFAVRYEAEDYTLTLEEAKVLQEYHEAGDKKPHFVYSADFSFPSPDELMRWLIDNRVSDEDENPISDLFDQNVIILQRWDPKESNFAGEDQNV